MNYKNLFTGNQYVMTYSSNANNSVSLADYISMNHDNIPLGHFLKFSPDSNKREGMESGTQEDGNSEMIVYEDASNQVIMNLYIYVYVLVNQFFFIFLIKKFHMCVTFQ